MFRKKKLFSFLLLFHLLFVHAQENKDAVPLKVILNEISSEYNIKFNYIDEELIIYQIAPPKAALLLSEKIAYLELKTGLKIKKISENYYSVYNNRKLDKPLCGYLSDSESGVPIENAIIKILNSNTTTFSNEKGYFELPVVSSNQIEISHMSFEKKLIAPIELYVSDCPTIKLVSIIRKLDEVTTQRYLTTGIYIKQDGSIEIKPRKFGILPGLIEPDVLQTMQQVPGIISVDETISNINVRGGTHDQNLFLWNGIRMFQTGHFFGLISAFNPSLAQTISITKNGSSAFFGESVSSLVDISSRTNAIEETNSSFSTNLISAEFYTKLKVSANSNLTLSTRRSLTDFLKSPTYRNYSNRIFQNTIITDLSTNEIVDYKSNVDFYFYDVTAQFQQKIGLKNELNIDIIAIENMLQFKQSTADLNRKSALEQESFGTTIRWKTNWNIKHSTEFKGYVSNYDLNSYNETIESNQILDQRNQVLDIGFEVRNSNIISNRITVNSGYQFNEIGVTNFDEINSPFFSRTITGVLLTHVGVAEGVLETESKSTFFKAGLRANYFGKFNFFLLEPRLQFSQALTSALQLEILGEQKSQTLSQIIDLQQDFLGVEKRRWTLANNSTIPIQKSNQVSLGLSFKKNNWLLTLDNFYKKITGITSNSQGFQNQFELEKAVGNYQVFGTEFLIQKSFNQFYTWLSYSYNDNKYDFDQLLNTSFPNNYDITHAISWAGIYEWKKLKLALGTKWHSGKPITTPTSFTVTSANPDIVYNSPNNFRLKDYFQVNFSASKEWKLKENMTLQTALSVLNLLNTKNSLNRFYRVNTADNSVESVDTYSLEMTPNFNIKLSF